MGIRLTARQLLVGYVVAAVALSALCYAGGHGERLALSALAELAGACAAVAGVAMHRPARRAPWLLLAGAMLASALGSLVGWIQVQVGGSPLPFPSWADVVYVLEYPLFVAALARFARARSPERTRRGLSDTSVLGLGLALLCVIFVILPAVRDANFSWPQRLVSAYYPVGDFLILITLSRLLIPGSWRGLSLALLSLGTVAVAASDVTYDFIENAGHLGQSPVLTMGWVAGYLAIGTAALPASMTELTRPSARAADSTLVGVVLLVITAMVPPVVLFVHGLTAHDPVEGVVAVACAVLYLLMLSRLWDGATSLRRSLVRERTLRMATSAFAAAGSVEQVAAAVRDAASVLVPGYPADRAAIVAVREGDDLRRVNPAGAPPRQFPLEPSWSWMPLLTQGRKPEYVPLDQVRRIRHPVIPGSPAPGSPSPFHYEGILLCPLVLKDRPSGDPLIGLLGFAGDEATLSGLAGTMESLAGQAALALERIGLSQEVVRQRGEALFRTLVQDTSDVILILGDDGRIRYATPSAADIFGEVAVEGARLPDLVGPSTRDDVERVVDLMLSLNPDGTAPGYLLQLERLDGRTAVIELRSSDLRGDATVGGLVLTLRDVSEQHQLEEELKYRAFHDSLTGLPNRALFTQETGTALEAARAVGRTIGVLFVDLDDFKVVNDTMGHSVGDELLVAVAARLAGAVRCTGLPARLGGDEFALLIEDAANPGAVDAYAQRIVSAFTEPFTLSEAKVLASATVGVATSGDSDDVDELLRHADLALYAAKSAGKRRWRHYEPVLTSGMLRRREVQTALEDAVASSAFTLAYQPIVSLASGEVAGFESLVRWPHPRWGMMLPGQFISLAEETGLIVPLGTWVLNQALRDMARWRAEMPPRPLGGFGATRPEMTEPHVSVNVSARQFRDPGFADSVREALEAAGLPPTALLLELTESLLLGGNDKVRDDLAELKDIGVRLAIDDFGTGYSSLSYLLELPIDVLKIDKTFVTGIATAWRRHALVEGIIRLARTLEVEVIAEGIESETERELLAAMGCQFGQGYLLSVPVDADAAESMLTAPHSLVRGLPQQVRRTTDRRYSTDL